MSEPTGPAVEGLTDPEDVLDPCELCNLPVLVHELTAELRAVNQALVHTKERLHAAQRRLRTLEFYREHE